MVTYKIIVADRIVAPEGTAFRSVNLTSATCSERPPVPAAISTAYRPSMLSGWDWSMEVSLIIPPSSAEWSGASSRIDYFPAKHRTVSFTNYTAGRTGTSVCVFTESSGLVL